MVGETVSHYRVLEKIGEGGMGQVYLAEDTSLERKVALKFLPEYLPAEDVAHKRFLREAKSAAAVDHPYICNIHEVSQTDDGQDFIVMEYVEGQTLKDRLEKGQLPRWLRQAFERGWRRDRILTLPYFKALLDENCVKQIVSEVRADVERMRLRIEEMEKEWEQ
jgi:serine/threonine protein kinase